MSEHWESAAMDGDAAASAALDIEALYEMYADDVLRVCYFYLNNRHMAEEVCQDTFVRLMTSKTQLKPGHEKAWLLKVALNRCRDLWRSGWVKRVVLGSPMFEIIPAEDTQERRDDEEAMMTAVHQLPPQFREVILLFYYQNFGISEIAQILSLPEGTISSRLSRARSKLKAILKGGDA
ncbi:MAG TPA: sigma-70 family RNA polymerase sigma factor [Candidatus Limiplasma sp.]|nr:sigma-70 family RNA polymerase sigma factor [Candidatus Limiplasma sp.]